MTDTEVARPKFAVDLLAEHQKYILADGTEVRGASTIAKLTKNHEALQRWANSQGRKGVDTTRTVKHAADAGTLAHGMIEAWLMGMDFDEENHNTEFLDRARLGFERFKPWWLEQGLLVLQDERGYLIEREMVSEQYRFGGTADIAATRLRTGRRVLIDIKTSDSGIWRDMMVQAFGYELLFEEVYGFGFEEVWIVRVGKERTTEIECRDITEHRDVMKRAFLAAVELDAAMWALPPDEQKKRPSRAHPRSITGEVML